MRTSTCSQDAAPGPTPRAARRRAAGRATERGFTLIELLIAMILFAIVSIPLWDLLFSQNRFFDTSEAATATQQNVRTALDRVANDVLLVGRGVNTLSLDAPSVIVPNDGVGPVNVLEDDAITLLSVPIGTPAVDFAASSSPGDASIVVTEDTAGVAAGLGAGDLILVHETNLNNSQVLQVTGINDLGGTREIEFAAADSLVYAYPAATSRMYTLGVTSYRLNETDPDRPFLERREDGGAWQRMVAGIEGLQFRYYDEDDTEIFPTTPALQREIHKVGIEVEGRSVRPIDNQGNHLRLELSTEVTPRNMLK